MQVVGVTLTAVAVPYRPELGTVVTSGLRLTEARHLLVEVHTDVGLVGLGEAVPRPSVYGEMLDGQRAILEGALIPPIIGMDPHATERAWHHWRRVVGNQSAKAALDVALHDLIARAAGIPLHRLLGGWTDGPLPLTMALGMGDPVDLAAAARDAVAGGYAGIKLKVGNDVDADLAAVAAVRDAIGPDALLYVDANGGYSRDDARRAMRGFDAHRLALVEEPVAAWDVDGRRDLARRSSTPLLLDEATNDLGAVPRELAGGRATAISVRAARSGITITRHLLGLASAFGAGCLVGSHRELGPGAAANAHIAASSRAFSYPAELGSHVFLEDPLLRVPLRIEDGQLTVPEGPGLGVELDPERVARYRLWTATIGARPG